MWRARRCAQWQFRDDGTIGRNPRCEVAMLWGIDTIDPTSLDGDRPTAGVQGAQMSSRVNPPSQARDDDDSSLGQCKSELTRDMFSVHGCSPGTDNPNDWPGQRFNITAHVE
jgi:hypothetical protein